MVDAASVLPGTIAASIGIVFLCIIGLAITFYGICVVCDNYLVPTVEVFIKQFKVPESIAAVTLVAFGSAAPELVLNSIGAIEQTSDISLAAVLGSAMIAFGLIPPLCLLGSGKVELHLKIWPIVRESSFYIIGLLIFLVSIADGMVTTLEACSIVSVYVVYVSSVIGWHLYTKSRHKHNGHGNVPYMLVSTNEVDDIKDSSEGTEMSGVELSSVSRSPKSVRSRSQGHGYGAVPEAAQRLATSTHSPGHDGLGLGLAGDLDGLDDFENIGKLLIEEDEEMPAVTKPIVDHSGPVNGRSTKVEAGNSIFDEEDDRIGAAQDDNAEAEEVNCQLPCPALERIRLFAMTAIETIISFGMPALRPSSSSSPTSITVVNTAIADPEAPVEATSNDDGDDDQEELVPLFRAFFSLFVCIVYVGILASAVVNLCSTLVDELGVGGSTLGATVVALGAEIPDTISAIALAKKGYNNAAMSGAIGSQVINISLGVGMPALVVCLLGNGKFMVGGGGDEATSSLGLLTGLVFIIIGTYVSMTLPLLRIITCRLDKDHHAAVTKCGSYVQLAVWIVVYLSFVLLNEVA